MDRDKRSNPDFNTVIIMSTDDDTKKEYSSINLYKIDDLLQMSARTITAVSTVIKNNILHAEDGKVKSLNDFEIVSLLGCMDLVVAKLHDQSLEIQSSITTNLQ